MNLRHDTRSANLGSCCPTLAAKTRTRLGWGTHFSWRMKGAKSNRRSFDSSLGRLAQDDTWKIKDRAVPAQTQNARLGWGTHFSWRMKGAKSNRRSFDSSLGRLAQDDTWKIKDRAVPAQTQNVRLGWGTHFSWRMKGAK